MINLIPNQEKKKKVKDFYFRLSIVFLSIMGFCIFIATVAILPSYFLSRVKKSLSEAKLETQKKVPLPPIDENTLAVIQGLNSKLDLVEDAEKNKYLVSQKVINELMLKKMPNIKITQIAYENSLPAGKKITIQGTAPSREQLLLFRRALEDDSAFKKVDLPISNFVKGSNIQFYLNLYPL